MNKKTIKRKQLRLAGLVLFLSFAAPHAVFADEGPGVMSEVVEPKPDETLESSAETEPEIENVTEAEGPLGPGFDVTLGPNVAADEANGSQAVEQPELVIEQVETEKEAESEDVNKGPGFASNESEDASEVVATEEVKQPYVPYTAEDVRVLARTAYFEMEMAINRADAEYVFKMTMSVILNRVTAPDFPNSVTGVVFSRGYAGATKRKVNSERVIPDIVYVWAEELLQNGPSVPTNVIYQSRYKQGHGVFDVVLGDYFCYR